MKNRILIIFMLLPLLAGAQVKKPINFNDYIEQVRQKNLVYAAEKLNISLADASLRSAKLFNDPSLSIEYANNDDHRMQMGQGMSVELSKTFSIGKRLSRIDLALSEKDMSIALLDDFFRNLRAEATVAYIEAIKQTDLYKVKLSSYNSINELAKADSIKFALGKITEVDAMQSRIEAGVIHNELLQASNDLYSSYAALNIPLGQFHADTLYVPIGVLDIGSREFVRGDLLFMALDNRSDLAAALKNVDVAQKALKLAHRERGIDFDLSLGYNHNTTVRNEIAPAPRFNGMTIGIAIPLKFSNFNRATLQTANIKANQAEKYYLQAQTEVQTEVTQNYNTYISLSFQMKQFNSGMLDESEAVLNGKTYSYNRGETSLLDVLNAQRTYNDVQALYIETLFNYACSLINLEKSVGIWDITIK
ncbi:MAG: TolC family protein [Rikenellaceae bacterium]